LAPALAQQPWPDIAPARVRGHGQVILKVTVAEVQRTVIKQLGINLNGSAGVGSAVVNSNNTNPLSVNWPL
jgi:pilus assembly protein CpaC